MSDRSALVLCNTFCMLCTLPGQGIMLIDVLQILDASNFSKGPVAKLWLKHHVPHGLHGFFSPKYFGPES